MDAPFINCERDASLGAFEVSIGRDDEITDAVQVFVYDDGHMEVKHYTATQLRDSLTESLIEAVIEAYPRLLP